MNLKGALLCMDCEEIYSIENQRVNVACPKCSSKYSIPLGNVLNRDSMEKNIFTSEQICLQ